MSSGDTSRRPVRSFVRRSGRITPAQRRALDTLWPEFGIDNSDKAIDFNDTFGRRSLCVLEIGFGNGDGLVELAVRFPELDFVGVEVHQPGIGRFMLSASKADLKNVRVIFRDAVEVLEHQIPDAALVGANIFFPDPWPKKRHHKRRIVQADFIELLAAKLFPGGFLHMATDWADYAEQMRNITNASPFFVNVSPAGGCIDRPQTRPLTHYEQRGSRLGLRAWDLLYLRTGESPAA